MQKSQLGDGSSSSETAPATPTEEVNPNMDLSAPSPAAPTPTEAVTSNTEPEAPAAESLYRGSEQDEEIKFPVRIKRHQTSTGEGTITGMPVRKAINMLEDLLGKCSVAQLRKISNANVIIVVNKMEGKHAAGTENQTR